MNIKYILIVLGEPYSIFSEIIGKYYRKKKYPKKKIILIGDVSLLIKQLNKLDLSLPLNIIEDIKYAKFNILNIINIKFNFKKIFKKIDSKSNKYIENSFLKALKIIKENKNECLLVNGPISKKSFLKKNYLGITEYLAQKTKSSNQVMLIYNSNISVSPLTTHIPLKSVNKSISKIKIINNIKKINNFYLEILRKKAKFAVLGLNPHCETIDSFSEEDKIILPAIKYLKKYGFSVDGPFSADTFFQKKNIDKYNVVLGMYHDQVLVPIKTLYNFNAINLTIGLPFVRISPDHGPNETMIGKNISDMSSFSYAMKFIDKIKK